LGAFFDKKVGLQAHFIKVMLIWQGISSAIFFALFFILRMMPGSSTAKRSLFGRFAEKTTQYSGSTPVFVGAVALVLVWAMLGPVFNYSETWQLVINTGTTIITFLMVFLIQRAQNKDSLVLHLKLNELLAATKGASNRLINAQDFSEEEIKLIHQFYCLLAEKAKQDNDLGETHSVEEAEDNHHEKLAAHRD
jgi:low affinity Fe/Cu permease